MNLLLGCFVFLGLLAILIIAYPLRGHSKKSLFVLTPLFVIFIAIAYQHWSGWHSWKQYVQEQYRQEQAKTLIAKIKPDELITRMRSRLGDTPEDARGWYLLGRLCASQGKWLDARDAFAKAHQLNPADETTTVNYAQSLWQLNNNEFNAQIKRIYSKLLEKNSEQPDALAMLAMDAFTSHNYAQAITYWQKLLKLAPAQSDEANAIRKAIAKAQSLQGSVRM